MGTLTGGPGAVTLPPGDRDAALDAVRAQLRVETAQDDALIVAFAETALGLAERYTGRALLLRAMVAEMPAAAGWQLLPVAPVRAITAVAAGRPAAVLAAGTFAVDIDAAGAGWIRADGVAAPLTVTIEAGEAASWAAIPAAIRQGVVLLAAHLFGDREGRQAPPAAVAALWRPFRDLKLAERVRA
ncbi:hypothetical protein ASG29_00415 [Sphingomonas sp. Leaf412]|uniref:head-tail connector protein n=1 Tax=Sphingomonas sp. Leaf412 TaxID=1736370 RepID=UPI00070108B2|nr:hypothetical protein [Sphingomonas sp. Leaf412]KQT34671.1 hypothetical protein ASG29_00415 [Sphingomonas sp. Leaf412]